MLILYENFKKINVRVMGIFIKTYALLYLFYTHNILRECNVNYIFIVLYVLVLKLIICELNIYILKILHLNI